MIVAVEDRLRTPVMQPLPAATPTEKCVRAPDVVAGAVGEVIYRKLLSHQGDEFRDVLTSAFAMTAALVSYIVVGVFAVFAYPLAFGYQKIAGIASQEDEELDTRSETSSGSSVIVYGEDWQNVPLIGGAPESSSNVSGSFHSLERSVSPVSARTMSRSSSSASSTSPASPIPVARATTPEVSEEEPRYQEIDPRKLRVAPRHYFESLVGRVVQFQATQPKDLVHRPKAKRMTSSPGVSSAAIKQDIQRVRSELREGDAEASVLRVPAVSAEGPSAKEPEALMKRIQKLTDEVLDRDVLLAQLQDRASIQEMSNEKTIEALRFDLGKVKSDLARSRALLEIEKDWREAREEEIVSLHRRNLQHTYEKELMRVVAERRIEEAEVWAELKRYEVALLSSAPEEACIDRVHRELLVDRNLGLKEELESAKARLKGMKKDFVDLSSQFRDWKSSAEMQHRTDVERMKKLVDENRRLRGTLNLFGTKASEKLVKWSNP